MAGSRETLVAIRYEQAVYGSFPFWDKGYALLLQSPGCRPEWLAELRTACQRFGEQPAGVAEVRGFFALQLARGPWMIVTAGSPGPDDRGRPGALAFHALFLSPRDYRRAMCNPFALAGALRMGWTAEDAARGLSAGNAMVPSSGPPHVPADPRAARIAAALAGRRRVAVEAAAPIDALAQQVWHALPLRVRRRATLATWAFANGNRFDLVALPRLTLAGGALDASYLTAMELEGREASPPDPHIHPGRRGLAWALSIIGSATALAVLIFSLTWHRGGAPAPALPTVAASRAAPLTPDRPPPDRNAYGNDQIDPEQLSQVTEALVALAERFGIPTISGGGGPQDPAALMLQLADRLHYHGPALSPVERAKLAAAADRESALALRWHAQIHTFAADRPLPGDFADGPLRWQLDTLAWSFHLDAEAPGGDLSAAEVPHALAEALANDVPLRPNALSAQHPALTAYREFLGRLPQR